MSSVQLAPADVVREKYRSARFNLLLMIGFTVLNILLLQFGSQTMLLFSATAPYLAIVVGQITGVPELMMWFLGIAGLCVLCYVACWHFSKKHYGWMIAALVLFILDTLILAGLYLVVGMWSGIMDVVFHGFVLYYLINGVRYGARLKTLPAETVNQIPM